MKSDSAGSEDNKIASVKDTTPSINAQSQQNEEIVQRIPIYEEGYSITKENTKTQLYLEKKWIKSTTKIEIPVKYEEMFINGREFDTYSQNELVEIFSKVKEKISEVIPLDKNKTDDPNTSDDESKKKYPNEIDIKYQKSEESPQKYGALIDKRSSNDNKELTFQNTGPETDQNSQSQTTNNNDEDEEKTIPIWAEQIIIDKRMVKLGEIIIRKSKIPETRNLDVEVRKEKVIAKYPDGSKKEII
jgi:stress response protein YsnF